MGYSPEFPHEFWRGPAICEQSKLTVMCEVVDNEIPLFSTAFAGSFLIVISLVCMSVQYFSVLSLRVIITH